MVRRRLDSDDLTILGALNQLDPEGIYEFNLWHPVFSKMTQGVLRLRPALESLKRRGLIAADGRGSFRSYGITEDGREALRALDATERTDK